MLLGGATAIQWYQRTKPTTKTYIINRTFETDRIHTNQNDEYIINNMKQNIEFEKYDSNNVEIKNNLCPIDYEPFIENEDISIFKNCT